MKSIIRAFLILCCSSIISVGFAFPKGSEFTLKQQEQIQEIIHQYIVNNPEILVEASHALRAKQMKKSKETTIKEARENADALFRSSQTPIAGNTQGKVTIVEFFDYQCLHCREMTKTIDNLVKANPNLRVVYKDFPIFGAQSVLAAKAALAAHNQGKYVEMHHKLITSERPLNNKTILMFAKKIGLNINQFNNDFKSKNIQKILDENVRLAKALKLIGTPEFLITRTDISTNSATHIESIPGAAPQALMQKAINKVSAE